MELTITKGLDVKVGTGERELEVPSYVIYEDPVGPNLQNYQVVHFFMGFNLNSRRDRRSRKY